jgi:hypothetical protein
MSDAVGKLNGGYDLGPLPRFEPEPASRLSFEGVSRALSQVGSVAMKASAGQVIPTDTLDGLINTQVEIQMLMLETSLRSNVEKARHDMEMAPVRNIRVS